jgi:hypothetical protein
MTAGAKSFRFDGLLSAEFLVGTIAATWLWRFPPDSLIPYLIGTTVLLAATFLFVWRACARWIRSKVTRAIVATAAAVLVAWPVSPGVSDRATQLQAVCNGKVANVIANLVVNCSKDIHINRSVRLSNRTPDRSASGIPNFSGRKVLANRDGQLLEARRTQRIRPRGPGED